MNRLKNGVLIIAAAALLLVSVSAGAQTGATCPLGPGDGPGMRGHGPDRRGPLGPLGEELGLTDEQKAEIRTIMAEEMPAARERIEERVAGVLTAEQQSMLEELKAEHPERGRTGKGRGMRGPGGPGGPGARLDRMAEALELSDDQQTAIREILADARSEKRADVREKINSVLTPEQQEKMDELHEQRQARMAERGGSPDRKER